MIWKVKSVSGTLMEDLVDRRGEVVVLVEGRVGRGVEDAEDYPLVFSRRQFLGGHYEHGHCQQGDHDPDCVDSRPGLQGDVEQAAIGVSQTFEIAGDAAGKAVLLDARFQHHGRHDRRKSKGHDPRDCDCAGQGEGEFPEQRAGQSSLQTDRKVNRRKRDGHGDDRPDQFTGADQGRLQRRSCPSRQVPFHILHNNDGVVDNKTDRQHDGKKGEQVDCEAEGLHKENRADQRHRDRHHRDEDRTEGAEEQER